MPMNFFKNNVERPNPLLLSEVKKNDNPLQFLANLYAIVDENDLEMNNNWESWRFPKEDQYTKVLYQLMKEVPDKGYIKPAEFRKSWESNIVDIYHRAAWLKEYIYDVAIAIGSDYVSFLTLVQSIRRG